MAVLALGFSDGWVLGLASAALGFVTPDLWLSQKTLKHKKAIQDGLPDALDLIIVCIEAGSSLDQAILKASNELEIALPVIAQHLKTLSSQIRAGKPRLEAFQRPREAHRRGRCPVAGGHADPDRSVRHQHRTEPAHARRNVCEANAGSAPKSAPARSASSSYFPLVLCLMPALYVVCLGPVAVAFYRNFCTSNSKEGGRLEYYHYCLARRARRVRGSVRGAPQIAAQPRSQRRELARPWCGRVRPSRGLCLLVWAMVSGCAAHGPRATSNPFVRPGKPTLEIGKPLGDETAEGGRRIQTIRPPAGATPSGVEPAADAGEHGSSAVRGAAACGGRPDGGGAPGRRRSLPRAGDSRHGVRPLCPRVADRPYATRPRTKASRASGATGDSRNSAPRMPRGRCSTPRDSASAHNTWGTVLTATGHRTDARREYERAVSLDPDAAYAWSNLCYLSFLERRRCPGGDRVPRGPLGGPRIRGGAQHDGVARTPRGARARPVKSSIVADRLPLRVFVAAVSLAAGVAVPAPRASAAAAGAPGADDREDHVAARPHRHLGQGPHRRADRRRRPIRRSRPVRFFVDNDAARRGRRRPAVRGGVARRESVRAARDHRRGRGRARPDRARHHRAEAVRDRRGHRVEPRAARSERVRQGREVRQRAGTFELHRHRGRRAAGDRPGQPGNAAGDVHAAHRQQPEHVAPHRLRARRRHAASFSICGRRIR